MIVSLNRFRRRVWFWARILLLLALLGLALPRLIAWVSGYLFPTGGEVFSHPVLAGAAQPVLTFSEYARSVFVWLLSLFGQK
ncbi:MAG: hypothetical protein AB1331_05460 [Bacillota bacterium]